MPRSLITSQRAFPFTLVLTVAVALLPPAALRWTRMPAEIVDLVLTPFALPGNALASWLRPPRATHGVTQAQVDELEHFRQEAAESHRMYLAERAKVDALERQLEQLHKLPPESMKTVLKAIPARIGPRSPASPVGTVVLSRGTSHGVKPGTIAVYDGDDLVGRVLEDVSPLQCTLMPLANAATALIDARIFPKEDRQLSPANAPAIQLKARGDGAFVGAIDRLKVVRPGDEVRLFDDRWPASARAMVVGTVESVQPDENEPLRNSIVVRPNFQVSQLSDVVLKIELDQDQHVLGSAPLPGRER